MSYAHDRLTRNRRQNPVPAPWLFIDVGALWIIYLLTYLLTYLIRYRFLARLTCNLVPNCYGTGFRGMLYFCAGLWYQFSGTGFWRRFLVRMSWALVLLLAFWAPKPIIYVVNSLLESTAGKEKGKGKDSLDWTRSKNEIILVTDVKLPATAAHQNAAIIELVQAFDRVMLP